MPIHLPPVSRRTFLIRSLLAGTAFSWGSRLAAADKPTGGNRWALLADTHISADLSRSHQGANMADHLTKVVNEIAAQSTRPAGVFVVGDCAFNRGEKGDYANLVKLLEPLRRESIPIHLALGNHDHREQFWAAIDLEKTTSRPVAGRQAALVRSPQANWFMLDSLDQTLSTPGLLGREQLNWLAETLDANTDKPALILAHHNPGKLAAVEGIKDTDAFYQIVRPRKHVKAFFFGHTHRWGVTADESGIHLVNLPPVSYVFRKAAPSGWVQASVENGGMKLELRCVEPSHALHGQTLDLKWRE